MNRIRIKYAGDANIHVFETGLSEEEFANEFFGGYKAMQLQGIAFYDDNRPVEQQTPVTEVAGETPPATTKRTKKLAS